MRPIVVSQLVPRLSSVPGAPALWAHSSLHWGWEEGLWAPHLCSIVVCARGFGGAPLAPDCLCLQLQELVACRRHQCPGPRGDHPEGRYTCGGTWGAPWGSSAVVHMDSGPGSVTFDFGGGGCFNLLCLGFLTWKIITFTPMGLCKD